MKYEYKNVDTSTSKGIIMANYLLLNNWTVNITNDCFTNFQRKIKTKK